MFLHLLVLLTGRSIARNGGGAHGRSTNVNWGLGAAPWSRTAFCIITTRGFSQLVMKSLLQNKKFRQTFRRPWPSLAAPGCASVENALDAIIGVKKHSFAVKDSNWDWSWSQFLCGLYSDNSSNCRPGRQQSSHPQTITPYSHHKNFLFGNKRHTCEHFEQPAQWLREGATASRIHNLRITSATHWLNIPPHHLLIIIVNTYKLHTLSILIFHQPETVSTPWRQTNAVIQLLHNYTSSHCYIIYTVSRKKLCHFCFYCNYGKFWPIWKLFHCWNQKLFLHKAVVTVTTSPEFYRCTTL